MALTPDVNVEEEKVKLKAWLATATGGTCALTGNVSAGPALVWMAEISVAMRNMNIVHRFAYAVRDATLPSVH